MNNDGSLAGQIAACPRCQGQFQMPPLAQPPMVTNFVPPAPTVASTTPYRSARRRTRKKDGTPYIIFGTLVALVFVAGIGVSLVFNRSDSPQNKPQVSQSHERQRTVPEPQPSLDPRKFSDLIRIAVKMQSATDLGVNIGDFSALLRDFNTELRLAKSQAANRTERDGVERFSDAYATYEDVLVVWTERNQADRDRLSGVQYKYGYIPLPSLPHVKGQGPLWQVVNKNGLPVEQFRSAPDIEPTYYISEDSVMVLMNFANDQTQKALDALNR